MAAGYYYLAGFPDTMLVPLDRIDECRGKLRFLIDKVVMLIRAVMEVIEIVIAISSINQNPLAHPAANVDVIDVDNRVLHYLIRPESFTENEVALLIQEVAVVERLTVR